LILRKIIKIGATRCQILRLKCTKFDFGWGYAPDPLGELTALPQTPSWFYGGLLLREGEGGEGRGQGREGKEGKEGKGEGTREGEGSPGLSRDRVGNPIRDGNIRPNCGNK